MSAFDDLPPQVIAQLSAIPERQPEDFTCAICRRAASNRWNYSPRDYHRPPICKPCEQITGYSWTGSPKLRTKPTGGTWRDRRECLRIGALADAIAKEATRQQWSAHHGRP